MNWFVCNREAERVRVPEGSGGGAAIIPSHYRGHSGCSLHKRTLEHLRSIRRGDSTSAMAAHFRAIHPGIQPAERVVTAKILGQRELIMERAISEAVFIEELESTAGVRTLNRKTEWGRQGLRRLAITE